MSIYLDVTSSSIKIVRLLDVAVLVIPFIIWSVAFLVCAGGTIWEDGGIIRLVFTTLTTCAYAYGASTFLINMTKFEVTIWKLYNQNVGSIVFWFCVRLFLGLSFLFFTLFSLKRSLKRRA